MKAFWKDEHFTVRWSDIPESARWSGEWKDFLLLPYNEELRYLTLRHHKSDEDGDLANIRVPRELQYLYLSLSNARNLGAVPSGLKRLEMHHCMKLESADGLAARCPELRHLHLHTCRRFRDVPELLKLKKLEVLCLNSCAELQDIRFLAKLPNLRDFRFVETNVVDGDLSPLLAHPRLEYVGSMNKRRYSHKVDDILELLASRRKSRSRPT